MQMIERRRQPLLIAAALLLVCALLWPTLSPLIRQPPQLQGDTGYLTAPLVLDGGDRQLTEALVYAEGGRIYLSAGELGRLLDVSVSSGSFRGQQALLVRKGDARAAYLVDGTLLTYAEGRDDVIHTPSAGRPLLLTGQWLIPIEQVAVGFCCLPEWDDRAGQLSLYGMERGLEQTVALASSHGLTLAPTGSAAEDRYLLDRVLPAEGEEGATLFDRTLGALFPATELTLTRSSYGFAQRTAEGLRGLFSMEGVQLLAPLYRSVEIFDADNGYVLTTDTDQRQRLWKCMDGGILSLTEESCRLIGQGYLKNGAPTGVTLLGRDLAAVSDDTGLWGVLSLQTGRLLLPCLYTAVGGYMDVGQFTYADGSRSGVLSGQQEQPTIFFDGEPAGIIVERDSLLGVVSQTGDIIFYPAFDAIFLLPAGDAPGWYGRRGEQYTLLQALPAGSRPILESAQLKALPGTTLLLQQRQEDGWWAADTATGTSYLLPVETGERLFGTNPVFSLVQVTERGGAPAAGSYPQPLYATLPVLILPEGGTLEQAALDYPALLLSRMAHSGGALGLTDFVVESCSASLGDRRATVHFTCTVAPQYDLLDPAVGSLWGEPGEDGRCRLTLALSLFEAVDESGRLLLCAMVDAETGQALHGLPTPRATETAYRYITRPLQRLYTELLAGAVEERVFYESDTATYIEARRLLRDGTPSQYHYQSEVLRLTVGEETPQPLFSMPEPLGGILAVAASEEGLLVSTWAHLFASSGQDGALGLLTDTGFTPLLEQAQVLGGRDGLLYLLARSEQGEGLHVLELEDLSHRLLSPFPIAGPGRRPLLQAITESACILALPTEGSATAYEVYSVDRTTGAAALLFPQ